MVDAIDSGASLVVGVHDPPRRVLQVGVLEHLVLCLGIVEPTLARFQVHRTQLPALDRTVVARLEAVLLSLVADRKPVLDQDDAGPNQHALELRHGAQKLPILLFAAKPHDVLDPRAVVPAAIEQYDLAGRGQVRDVALKVPLSLFALGRRRERCHAAQARTDRLGDAFDRAALTRCVAALEQRHDAQTLLLDPRRELDELRLHSNELGIVRLSFQLLLVLDAVRVGAAIAAFGVYAVFLAHRSHPFRLLGGSNPRPDSMALVPPGRCRPVSSQKKPGLSVTLLTLIPRPLRVSLKAPPTT